jgi:hypothetical protein
MIVNDDVRKCGGWASMFAGIAMLKMEVLIGWVGKVDVYEFGLEGGWYWIAW